MCERPLLTCNVAFTPLLGDMLSLFSFPPGDSRILADRIAACLDEKNWALVRSRVTTLSRQVRREHDVRLLAARLIHLFDQLTLYTRP